jgi:hypothetical protein
MAVFKSTVEVRDASNRPIGAGQAYVHLRLAADAEQRVTGTVSLRRWEPADAAPTWLTLEDGRHLSIEVSREVLSECSRNHILRFQAAWPPRVPGEGPGEQASDAPTLQSDASADQPAC